MNRFYFPPDPPRPQVFGSRDRCASCEAVMSRVLVLDPESAVPGDACWLCGDCYGRTQATLILEYHLPEEELP